MECRCVAAETCAHSRHDRFPVTFTSFWRFGYMAKHIKSRRVSHDLQTLATPLATLNTLDTLPYTCPSECTARSRTSLHVHSTALRFNSRQVFKHTTATENVKHWVFALAASFATCPGLCTVRSGSGTHKRAPRNQEQQTQVKPRRLRIRGPNVSSTTYAEGREAGACITDTAVVDEGRGTHTFVRQSRFGKKNSSMLAPSKPTSVLSHKARKISAMNMIFDSLSMVVKMPVSLNSMLSTGSLTSLNSGLSLLFAEGGLGGMLLNCRGKTATVLLVREATFASNAVLRPAARREPPLRAIASTILPRLGAHTDLASSN